MMWSRLFARRPRSDPQAVTQVKSWVRALMRLGPEDHVSVAELACCESGCPDLETVITVTRVDRQRVVLRFPSAIAAVNEADVQSQLDQMPAG